jgi:hypothetical protein
MYEEERGTRGQEEEVAEGRKKGTATRRPNQG